MRAAKTLWRFLSHPVLSVAGNLSLLVAVVPFAAAVVVGVVGRVIDQPALFVVAVGLGLAGFVVVATLTIRQRRLRPSGRSSSPQSKPSGLSPAERREQLDNLFFPPRDDRRELGEECTKFAIQMHVFNEEQEWKRERTIARNVREIREADPDIDPFQARRDAESFFAQTVETTYALSSRDEALRLFDAAREQGAIAAKTRRLVERPLAVEMGEIPDLFVALARRLTGENVTERRASGSSPSLAGQLDALLREGQGLVDELNVSVQPERAGNGWKLDGGGAPDEWWENADNFAKRIRELLLERHPALLTDYRDGYNAHVKKERKEDKEREPAQDKRSTPEKMLDLANFERSGPRRVVEASLEGLALARHQI